VPANAVVVPFAPQLTLLKRAALLITHCGLNTALEGLARGLPMLCVPVTNDQPGVASRVQWLGAGEVLKPSRATPGRVRELVGKLLSEWKYREAAGKCRDRMAGGPGVARAADIVEEALRTGKRVER
jgi:MGT family glycosyltransferase